MGGARRVGVEWEEMVGVWGRGCWAPSPKASPFQVGDSVSGSHRQGRCLFRNFSACGSVGFGTRELIGMIIDKQALGTLGTVMGTLDSSWVEQELVHSKDILLQSTSSRFLLRGTWLTRVSWKPHRP